jgi:hypothetical protein
VTIEETPASTRDEEAPAAPLDLARVQAEIAEEVRRRRATGDFPPGLERELDAMFARYAPASASDDFDDVLAFAETQSFIHADVPTASRRAPLAYVKRVLRAFMAWYVRFLAQQVTAFAGAITRAVSLLGRRVDALETATAVAPERALVRGDDAGSDLSAWLPLVVGAMADAPGRVLHAEAGRGRLVQALADGGIAVYGIEPVEETSLEAARAGLDVRTDDVLAHLRNVPDGALGGVVLSGCVDRLPLGEVLAVANRAVAALAPGGVVVVLSVGPGTWARGLDPVLADLAPGRPLHPETWAHLLSGRGLVVDPVRTGPGRSGILEPVPDTTPGAAVLNANAERLERLLFGPGPYAVVAHRPR